MSTEAHVAHMEGAIKSVRCLSNTVHVQVSRHTSRYLPTSVQGPQCSGMYLLIGRPCFELLLHGASLGLGFIEFLLHGSALALPLLCFLL